jgi:hypothetical protein
MIRQAPVKKPDIWKNIFLIPYPVLLALRPIGLMPALALEDGSCIFSYPIHSTD